ncbi:uncharacterized protein LOC126576898 [Anopheles aquasalis]|uniref:uncharacterized protein LOC126576898 n=1 Tax=Anopheles aquasalis TaxID=42839 RepID=UPI00215AECBC|nr:uncharacterized protein LOC126576898 [Anopheles aquasalis]
MDLNVSRTTLSQKRDFTDECDTDIDESIFEIVRNISMMNSDSSLSFKSVHSERAASLSRSLNEDNSSSPGQILNLRKTISETVFDPEDMLANASCSTPVTKTAVMGEKTKEIRKPCVTRTKSAIELHRNSSINASMQPVVLLQPLTEQNLKQHELSHPRIRSGRNRTVSKCRYKDNDSENDESTDTRRQGGKLEHGFSTENLSVQSYESRRPRRKAAPVNMREPSINSKLRRE